MRKAIVVMLGVLVISGSAFETSAAFARGAHQLQATAGEQVRIAGNSVSQSCKTQEAGNPYDQRTDYTGWSAWRQLGAWDSRNDCW